ncbi:trypsin-like peptidase domain-containing protein [Streptomyces fructofermentans]|uniref:trypsin-like peptidase domain-containing protein n=1 Tax=Streptomyces fructofermentans TaxID=152141 RepID=UPI0037922282
MPGEGAGTGAVRAGDGRPAGARAEGASGPGEEPAARALVRIRDGAGRPRGAGFAADHRGTVVTSHEAVDGQARLVVHAPDGGSCPVTADDITFLPGLGLALVRTTGLGLAPLPIAARGAVGTGAYVRVAAGGWREARVLGTSAVTYTAAGRAHRVGAALELAIGTAGRDALRPGGGASGGPVVDASTGAVVAVLGTALHSGQPVGGLAVPLRADSATADGELAGLLARNASSVPAYGADLNLAGVLELTAALAPPPASGDAAPVERGSVLRELTAFADGPRTVLGLVGAPGSGRTTELAALAARRRGGAAPAPTLWLRGADLLDGDRSVADAARRALERAARIAAAPGLGTVAAGTAPQGWVPDPGPSGRPAHTGTGTHTRTRTGTDTRPSRSGAGGPGDRRDPTAEPGPGRSARLARDAGRPLLLLLDGPEEMPPALLRRLPEWTAATADWLEANGARLVVACRTEHWERAGHWFPPESLHVCGHADAEPDGWSGGLPACVRLGDLDEGEALRARERHGVPEGVLHGSDARHPLTLRLLSQVVAATSGARPGRIGREEVFAAYLDLMCLRVAVRLAAANGLRGTAVRRLAARVSGQVHVAARRCLGPGHGELDRASFESLFPWGPVPDRRLGGCTGWASAVLAEGLLVPAGDGYRFAHEEFADWIQGVHLDLGAALDALVHREVRDGTSRAERPLHGARGEGVAAPPVRDGVAGAEGASSRGRAGGAEGSPVRHGVARAEGSVVRRRAGGAGGSVVRQRAGGAGEGAAGRDRGEGADGPAGRRAGAPALLPAAGRHDDSAGPDPVPRHRIGPVLQALLLVPRQHGDAVLTLRLSELLGAVDRLESSAPGAWWAGHLLRATLLRVPDATPYLGVLRHLAERVVSWRAGGRRVPGGFGPGFWAGLPLPEAHRFDLLRRLVVADAAPPAAEPRYLDTVSRRLAADPAAVQPHLTHWFDDGRPLPATPEATVATAAQVLLHTHRHRAPDDLIETLAGSGHPRADELLAVLARDEPSAVCRAVARWARDERPARRAAAVAHGLRTAPHARAEADRELLRGAALALLGRPGDCTLHGSALALLVRDPQTRARHLPQALARFRAGDPRLPASAPAAALATHPEAVLDAFRDRLRQPDGDDVLRPLVEAATPPLAPRVADLLRDTVGRRPGSAAHVAASVRRRLERGLPARGVLRPLVGGLLDGGTPLLRAALAEVFAAPGTPESAHLRREFLELLLAREDDPAVLDALVRAAAAGAAHSGEEHTRTAVLDAGRLLVRTPEGAARFDRALVDLGRRDPAFAALVAHWLADAPGEWTALAGPGTRRMIGNPAGAPVPA